MKLLLFLSLGAVTWALPGSGGILLEADILLPESDAASATPRCKCVPGQKCWPSDKAWRAIDASVDGALVKTEPVAQSCYPGDLFDENDCAYVSLMWPDQDFQTTNPIGRPYPFNITCPPVDYQAGEQPTKECSLGQLPTYAVNATKVEHIRSALAAARRYNLRLTVASTGHDLLGRADGYGSLEIWLRHFRNGINFQEKYESANSCSKSGWDGAAIHIDGAWQWRDVYAVAEENNVIVVGGGSPSPGAIGGWPSGGGHGPATRNYGMGADQILEAQIMLADGSIVTANHCQHKDLFKAIRGGGPGYGITLSTTIKAHPNVDVVTAHKLTIAPMNQTPENKDLLDAVTVMLQAYPNLNDAGYAGYAFWFRNFQGPFIGDISSGYSHGIWTIGKGREEAEAAFQPVRQALSAYSDRLYIQETWASYNDYWTFYHAESGLYDPVGSTSITTSRLVDAPSLQDYDTVRNAVEVLSGDAQEYASNVVLLVSGGQVFKDAQDKTSGLNPAWRKSHFGLITGRGIPKDASNELRQAVNDDITYVKGAAAKALAPTTGGYMNEGDANDPDYIETFYGSQYKSHLKAKFKYDPAGVFFCPTCVGSERYVDSKDGPLCRK